MMRALACSLTDWGDCLQEFLEFSIGKVLGGLFDKILEAIKTVVVLAVEGILNSIGKLWLELDTIPLSHSGGDTESTIAFAHNQTFWLVAFAGGVSIIIAGIRMAWYQRGEPARELFKSLTTLVVVSAGGVAIVSALTQLSDALAQDIINDRLGEHGETFANRMGELVTNPLDGTGLAIVLLFGITAIITCMIQIVIMIARNAMLVLLVAVLPMAAAATNTEMGMAWFKKCCGWLVAFIAYKPVAALVYATALALAGNAEGDMVKVITGVTMMVLAVVALPALIRLVAPKG